MNQLINYQKVEILEVLENSVDLKLAAFVTIEMKLRFLLYLFILFYLVNTAKGVCSYQKTLSRNHQTHPCKSIQFSRFFTKLKKS